MANYKVKPGYCLHLQGRCFEPGIIVNLSPELEADVLKNQPWKVEIIPETPLAVTEEVESPPVDRAVKSPRVSKKKTKEG